jgi:NitT/TauT family transport system permease protein
MASITDGQHIASAGDDGSIEAVEARVQRERARLLRRDRVTRVLYPVLAVVTLLVTWELGRDMVGLPRFLLPSPSEILDAMVRNQTMLLRAAWVTGMEVVLGFALSVLVGIPLAVAIFQSPVFSKAIYPILVSFQAVPKVAVAPLFIVWFGFGMLPKVLIAFLIAFFPVVINTIMNLASIEREKIHLARSIGLSSFETFRLIRFPNALPSIFAGLKISITLAVVGAVVGEFVGGNAGLGYTLMLANGSMDTALLFGAIFALSFLGYGLFWLVEMAERLCLPHVDRANLRGETG